MQDPNEHIILDEIEETDNDLVPIRNFITGEINLLTPQEVEDLHEKGIPVVVVTRDEDTGSIIDMEV